MKYEAGLNKFNCTAKRDPGITNFSFPDPEIENSIPGLQIAITIVDKEISSCGTSAALCAVYLLEWRKPETKYVSVEALHKQSLMPRHYYFNLPFRVLRLFITAKYNRKDLCKQNTKTDKKRFS